MDLKPLTRTLMTRAVDLALASGVPPDELATAFDAIIRDRVPSFRAWSEPSPRVKDVLDLTCGCAESVILLLVALRPDPFCLPRGLFDGSSRQGEAEGPGGDVSGVSAGSALEGVQAGLSQGPSADVPGVSVAKDSVPPSDIRTVGP